MSALKGVGVQIPPTGLRRENVCGTETYYSAWRGNSLLGWLTERDGEWFTSCRCHHRFSSVPHASDAEALAALERHASPQLRLEVAA